MLAKMDRNTLFDSIALLFVIPARRLDRGKLCILVAVTILLFPQFVMAEPTADDAPKVPEIKTIWNLRYSDAVGNAGLCDLYLPILPNDRLQGDIGLVKRSRRR